VGHGIGKENTIVRKEKALQGGGINVSHYPVHVGRGDKGFSHQGWGRPHGDCPFEKDITEHRGTIGKSPDLGGGPVKGRPFWC